MHDISAASSRSSRRGSPSPPQAAGRERSGGRGSPGTGAGTSVEFAAKADGVLTAVLSAPGGGLDLALLDGTGRRLSAAVGAAAGHERLASPVRGGEAYTLVATAFAGGPADFVIDLRVRKDRRAGPVSGARTRLAAPLAGARCFHALAPLPDGGAIVAGGTTEVPADKKWALLYAVSTTEIFDARRRRFAPGPPLSAVRFGLTATALPDGRVLLAGGDLPGTADLYDPGDGSMTAIPLAAGSRFLHTATLLSDGRVLLAGGIAVTILPSPGYQTLATTEVFDPKTATFSPGPALLATRLSHAAWRARRPRPLAGGEGRADTEFVDPGAAFTSAAGPPLSGPRDDHSATLLPDGRVLIAGGQGPGGASLDTAEVLDPGGAVFRVLPARLAVAAPTTSRSPSPRARCSSSAASATPGPTTTRS